MSAEFDLAALDGVEDSPSSTRQPAYDTPIDHRPDLSELGILEHEKGICDDSFENRSALRRARLNWDFVYDQSGFPTGMIAARSEEASKERRLLSLATRKALLADPLNHNCDYLTGLDLILTDDAVKICPPWVIGSTKAWIAEQQEGGQKSSKRAPASLPHRCKQVKSDGIRCLLWSSGRIKDDGLCRLHLRTVRKPGEDIERARAKLIQAAPYAVDVLEELMESASSEPVRLKASTEILDRAGVRGGSDLSIGVEVSDARPAHIIVSERLQRLAEGAISVAARLAADGQTQIADAEIVEPGENNE